VSPWFILLSENNQQSGITDSAWFWALIFALMGLVALFAMHGKYSRRQANIERNYQARTRVAEQVATENNSPEPDRMDHLEVRRDFAKPDENLVPLWPLAVLLGGVAIVSAAMLYRGHVRGDFNSSGSESSVL
jgi:hypothetical protein